MVPFMNEGHILGQFKIIKATDKAILVHPLEDDYGDDIWIPKSVIHYNSEIWNEEGSEGLLVVAEWWAKAQGMA